MIDEHQAEAAINSSQGTKWVIAGGFILVMILMVLVAGVSLYRMDDNNQKMGQLVEEEFNIINGVSDLRNVARERGVLLFSIVTTEDPFERDDFIQTFYQFARDFIEVRERMQMVVFTPTQQFAFDNALEIVREGSAFQNQVAVLAESDRSEEALELLTQKVVPNQRALMAAYDELLQALREDVDDVLKEANEKNQATRSLSLVLVLVTFIPVILIAVFVTRRILNAEQNLRELNATLESRVTERTKDLEESNRVLSQTVDTLNEAQKHLVQSEKLASLGSLVAGISHEINTPLGISVTINSTMQERLKEFNKVLASGQLKKSTLDSLIEHLQEATELLSRNLHRAADLIGDFKQVAVDQTSTQRRKYNLQRVILEVVETLQPQFKKTSHRVDVYVPDDIEMDGYPGPLGQVITNLALNALIHGFNPEMEGVVEFHGEVLPDDRVRLEVKDNGKGISPDHLSKVFDPFFTTRLGKGGSGIGMHIVYTVITKTLGGKVDIESEPGKGTKLVMELPYVAPAL